MKLKEKLKEIDKSWKAYALAGCICALFVVILLNLGGIGTAISSLFKVLTPVILGFVIAYIANLLAVLIYNKILKFVEKDSLRWILSVVLTVVVVLLIIAVLVVSLIPQIVSNVVSFMDNYEVYVARLKDIAYGLLPASINKATIDNVFDSLLSESGLIPTMGTAITTNVPQLIKTTTEIGTAAFNVLIGAIFAVYFLLAKNPIKKTAKKSLSLMLSPLKYERVMILSEKFHAIFSKYIACELIDALIVGVACYLFMLIFGMPDAILISVIIGATNLIPTFGPIIGGVIGCFLLLLLSPSMVLPMIIFVFVIQAVDGYVIKPKLFGNALNVPGALILTAIVVFGKFMGVVGMLIAIPIAAIIAYIYSEVLIPWLELKRELAEMWKESGKY